MSGRTLFTAAAAAAARTRDDERKEEFGAAVRALDLTHCQRIEFVLPLYPFERAGLTLPSWPPAVRARMQTELDAFFARGDVEVLCHSTALGAHRDQRAAILILHYRVKPAGACPCQ